MHFWPLHSGYPCTTFSNYSTKHEPFDGYWEPLWSIHTADTKTDTDTDKMGTEPNGNLYWCLSLWATWNFHTTLDKSFLPFCVSGSVSTTFLGRHHYDHLICKEIVRRMNVIALPRHFTNFSESEREVTIERNDPKGKALFEKQSLTCDSGKLTYLQSRHSWACWGVLCESCKYLMLIY